MSEAKDPITDIRNFILFMIILAALNFLLTVGGGNIILKGVGYAALIAYLIVTFIGLKNHRPYSFYMTFIYLCVVLLGIAAFVIYFLMTISHGIKLMGLVINLIVPAIILIFAIRALIKLMKNKGALLGG